MSKISIDENGSCANGEIPEEFFGAMYLGTLKALYKSSCIGVEVVTIKHLSSTITFPKGFPSDHTFLVKIVIVEWFGGRNERYEKEFRVIDCFLDPQGTIDLFDTRITSELKEMVSGRMQSHIEKARELEAMQRLLV